VLNFDHHIDRIIADAVWNTSSNLRDCMRIGRLAQPEEDVKFLLELLRTNQSNSDTLEWIDS